jgi:cytoskeleton protein RodZ
MADEQIALEGQEAIKLTGDRLREAREALGLTLADVAQRTRITQRHLRAVEESQFSELPGRTYVTGFARAYARAVNLPEADVAAAVRRELEDEHYTARPLYEAYEPTDPARLPPKRLAITFAIITALLASAYGVWRFVSVEPDEALRAAQMRAADDKAPAAVAPAAKNAAAGQTIAADAPVILSASSDVWIGFDDAQGKARDSRTLKSGEQFQLPADYVANYTLRTSRPQALQITVGGRDVGALGSADLLVKNVSLKVADLIARADSNGTSKAIVPQKTTAAPSITPPPAASGPATTSAPTR